MKKKIKYTFEKKTGNIILDVTKPPFNGDSVLIQTSSGWVEAHWIPSEPTVDYEGNKDDNGFCWCLLDGMAQVELDDPMYWDGLPK